MKPQELANKYRALIKERMGAYDIRPDHDNTGHYYVFEGKRYPSVTKELATLKDEGLMNWKMNRALGYVQEYYLGVLSVDKNEEREVRMEKLIAEAKLAPQLEFEGAGDIGRQVHDWRETWFTYWIETNKDPAPVFTGTDPSVISGCRGIKKFVDETGYIPVACELSLASHDIGVGGMLDDVGILPNPVKVPKSDPDMGEGYKTVYKPKLCLIDLKTSNIGDKTSYFLQVAFYYYMFKKMTGISCQEFYILHVSKTDGSYKLIPINNMRELIKDAKLLIKLNKSLARINQDKKKEPIII
jgi:hypothetical protein